MSVIRSPLRLTVIEQRLFSACGGRICVVMFHAGIVHFSVQSACASPDCYFAFELYPLFRMWRHSGKSIRDPCR